MSEGHKSHTDVQALKNNQDVSASEGQAQHNQSLTPGHLWVCGQVLDAPSSGDVPTVILHLAGHRGH